MQQSIDCQKLSIRSPSLLIKTWQRASCFDLSLLRYNDSEFSVTDYTQNRIRVTKKFWWCAKNISRLAVDFLARWETFQPTNKSGSKKEGHKRALPKKRNLDEIDSPPQFGGVTNKTTMQFFEQWARPPKVAPTAQKIRGILESSLKWQNFQPRSVVESPVWQEVAQVGWAMPSNG